jgi:hypothetical protein
LHDQVDVIESSFAQPEGIPRHWVTAGVTFASRILYGSLYIDKLSYTSFGMAKQITTKEKDPSEYIFPLEYSQ